MRISAGKFKGRLLKSPSGKKIRPTSAKVKEAFFNIIGGCFENINFLDLFSGTGSIGLEALSRGAECAFFVENNRFSLEALRKNIEFTGIQARAQILPLDVRRALQLLSKKKESFEIIYIDPPYDYQEVTKILNYLHREGLVKEGGIIGVERSSQKGRAGEIGLEKVPFHLWKKRAYGNTLLLIFINAQSRQNQKRRYLSG